MQRSEIVRSSSEPGRTKWPLPGPKAREGRRVGVGALGHKPREAGHREGAQVVPRANVDASSEDS